MYVPPLAVRAAAAACIALFVLPSCFTFTLWREGNRSTYTPFASPAAVGATSGSEPIRFCCLGRPTGYWIREAEAQEHLHEVLAQWQPAPAEGSWLEVEPLEHAGLVARLWREDPAACGIQVVRNGGEGAEPECWFTYPFEYVGSGLKARVDVTDLPNVQKRAKWSGGAGLVFEVRCRVRPTTAAATAGTDQLRVALFEPAHGPVFRTLLTPPAVALDIVLFPIELLGIGTWW